MEDPEKCRKRNGVSEERGLVLPVETHPLGGDLLSWRKAVIAEPRGPQWTRTLLPGAQVLSREAVCTGCGVLVPNSLLPVLEESLSVHRAPALYISLPPLCWLNLESFRRDPPLPPLLPPGSSSLDPLALEVTGGQQGPQVCP